MRAKEFIIEEGLADIKNKLMSAYQNLSQSQEFVAAFRKFYSNKTLINSIVEELQLSAKNKTLTKEKIVDIIKAKIPVTEEIVAEKIGASLFWDIVGIILILCAGVGTGGVGILIAFGVVCILSMLTHNAEINNILNPQSTPTSLEHKMFEADLETEKGKITSLTVQAMTKNHDLNPNASEQWQSTQNKILAIQKHYIQMMVHEVQIPAGPYDKRLIKAKEIVSACKDAYDQFFTKGII